MKTLTANPTTNSNRWPRFFRAMLTVALMTPVLAMSQPTTITSIGGQVTTGGTTPVAGAKVVLILANVRIDSSATDAGGNYFFNSAADSALLANNRTGTRQVQASKPSLVTTTATATSSVLNINCALASGAGNVHGTVSRSSDNTPIVGAKVLLKRGTTGVDSVQTDAVGRYSFSNTAGTNYSLVTSAASFFTTTTTLTINANTSVVLNLLLAVTAPGTITGTVKNALDTTQHIANALVVLTRGSASGTFVSSTQTNSSGVYTFSGVAPGAPNYWITVSANGYITSTTTATTGLTVGNGATVTSNYTLVPPGNITGFIRNVVSSQTVTPMTNVLVLLRRGSATAAVTDSTRSDAQGFYAFHNLPPAALNYWVTAITTIGTATHDTLTVNAGATTSSDFTFIQSSALYPALSGLHRVHFIRMGDRLALDLGVSTSIRTVSIFNLNGTLQHRVFVEAGGTQAIVPAKFAPEKGFLFQVK